jgi:hypothetical protein
MTARCSPFREIAETIVRTTIRKATRRGSSVARLRRVLRDAFATLLQTNLVALPKRPRGVWYAAIRSVTGGGVRALVDPRQQKLPLDLGPAVRRRRRPRKNTS